MKPQAADAIARVNSFGLDLLAEGGPEQVAKKNLVLTDFGTLYEGLAHIGIELALGWVASQPETASVLVGATKAEQVTANAAAIAWRLTVQERGELEGALA